MAWGRRSSSRKSRYDDYWPRYVPVSERREQAHREVAKLRKKGRDIQPIEIDGRTIARSFWGKEWCTHLESFGDYSNRLPRGRTYVRNGSVCHLAIDRGKVEAIVSGSALYRVNVRITPLQQEKWNVLKQQCVGKIGSLIELLQGRLSDEIMRTVTDRGHGLFPLPGEMKYTCSCLDWADMCKHISAVMYGIGARLDTQPELLFLLRGVDHAELISADAAVEAIAGKGSRRARRRSLSAKDLNRVFGVELDDAQHAGATMAAETRDEASVAHSESRPPARKATGKRKATTTKAPFKPTARSISKLRQRLGMSRAEFAGAVGVSPATVANWEKARGCIKPHASGLAGLQRLQNVSKRQ